MHSQCAAVNGRVLQRQDIVRSLGQESPKWIVRFKSPYACRVRVFHPAFFHGVEFVRIQQSVLFNLKSESINSLPQISLLSL